MPDRILVTVALTPRQRVYLAHAERLTVDITDVPEVVRLREALPSVSESAVNTGVVAGRRETQRDAARQECSRLRGLVVDLWAELTDYAGSALALRRITADQQRAFTQALGVVERQRDTALRERGEACLPAGKAAMEATDNAIRVERVAAGRDEAVARARVMHRRAQAAEGESLRLQHELTETKERLEGEFKFGGVAIKERDEARKERDRLRDVVEHHAVRDDELTFRVGLTQSAGDLMACVVTGPTDREQDIVKAAASLMEAWDILRFQREIEGLVADGDRLAAERDDLRSENVRLRTFIADMDAIQYRTDDAFCQFCYGKAYHPDPNFGPDVAEWRAAFPHEDDCTWVGARAALHAAESTP